MMRRVLWATLLVIGCTKQDSDNILTRGMYASMSATAGGNGSTDVSATLYLEDPIQLDFIELEGDDRLVAWQGSMQRTMTEFDFLNIVSYHATFDIDAEDTEFQVQLVRTVDAGAPDSFATMPAPFTLTTPPPATASRAAEVTFGWSPSGTADAMSWEARGDCIDLATGTIVGDPGTWAIGPGILQKKMQQDGQPAVPDSCTVTLTVRRAREGMVDDAFEEGGQFTAAHGRSADFTSNP
jgi:hypothetical protein